MENKRNDKENISYNMNDVIFTIGVIFTLTVPVLTGAFFDSTGAAWIAALCGGLVMVIARLGDIAEFSFGPLKARMREALVEAYAKIAEVRALAASSTRAAIADLMAGAFFDGMTVARRLKHADELLSALDTIGVNIEQKKMVLEPFRQVICLIYHRAIRNTLRPFDGEQLQLAVEWDRTLDFPEWKTAEPTEMETFWNSKNLMTTEIQQWIDDYRHFLETGEIRRRREFEKQ